MQLRALLLLLSWLWAATAGAVVISTGDGSGNIKAPADDPGFYNVGTLSGASAVYLGAGWVITANHVSAGDPRFVGSSFHAVAGSSVQLRNADGSLADLRVFRVDPWPLLRPLLLAPAPPAVGAEVVMVGYGRDRGPAVTWDGWSGWSYGTEARSRWGTNSVTATDLHVLDTCAFELDFSEQDATASESQAVLGDSGGAVFVKSGLGWSLAGVLFAIGPYRGQPWDTALLGNVTYAAQVSDYVGALSGLVGQPVCSDGLDQDGDGKIDFPDDPGCVSADSATESPACNDGIDNDGDGLIDLDDPGCDGQAFLPYEAPPACGLGFEIVATLPAFQWLRGRRRSKTDR